MLTRHKSSKLKTRIWTAAAMEVTETEKQCYIETLSRIQILTADPHNRAGTRQAVVTF